MQNSQKIEKGVIVGCDVSKTVDMTVAAVLTLKASKELSANILDELNVEDPEVVPDEIKNIVKK